MYIWEYHKFTNTAESNRFQHIRNPQTGENYVKSSLIENDIKSSYMERRKLVVSWHEQLF